MKYPRRTANQAHRVLCYLPSLKNCSLNRLRCRRLGTNCLSCLVNRVPVDSVSPDIPMNPPVFGKILLQDVPKTREKVKARRYQSNPLQRKRKEPRRPRFVSELCGNTYTQLMEKQGAKLTNAAYELTEEQSRLLYEDMFKPLDVFALI